MTGIFSVVETQIITAANEYEHSSGNTNYNPRERIQTLSWGIYIYTHFQGADVQGAAPVELPQPRHPVVQPAKKVPVKQSTQALPKSKAPLASLPAPAPKARKRPAAEAS